MILYIILVTSTVTAIGGMTWFKLKVSKKQNEPSCGIEEIESSIRSKRTIKDNC